MVSPAPSPLRLFLALWPDDETRAGLAEWRDRWSWPPGASPTRTERLHLTLHFIGQVAADGLDALRQTLVGVDPAGDVTLEIGRAELWAHGIAVVCPFSTPSALLQLHANLGLALASLALPIEQQPLRPHVTVGRRAQRAVPPVDGPAVRWHVTNGFALVHSLPGGHGYRVLQTFS